MCKTKTRKGGPELSSTNVSSGDETCRKKTLKKNKNKNNESKNGVNRIALDKGKIMRGKVGKTIKTNKDTEAKIKGRGNNYTKPLFARRRKIVENN